MSARHGSIPPFAFLFFLVIREYAQSFLNGIHLAPLRPYVYCSTALISETFCWGAVC